MPLKVQNLNKQRNTFTWKYMGEEIEITYNPQAFTPATEAEINSSVAGNTQAKALVHLLRSFLVDWDLVENVPTKEDENGIALPEEESGEIRYVEVDGVVQERPFGLSEAKMMTLPIVFLGDVTAAITGDINALRAEGKPSTAGSLRAVT